MHMGVQQEPVSLACVTEQKRFQREQGCKSCLSKSAGRSVGIPDNVRAGHILTETGMMHRPVTYFNHTQTNPQQYSDACCEHSRIRWWSVCQTTTGLVYGSKKKTKNPKGFISAAAVRVTNTHTTPPIANSSQFSLSQNEIYAETKPLQIYEWELLLTPLTDSVWRGNRITWNVHCVHTHTLLFFSRPLLAWLFAPTSP